MEHRTSSFEQTNKTLSAMIGLNMDDDQNSWYQTNQQLQHPIPQSPPPADSLNNLPAALRIKQKRQAKCNAWYHPHSWPKWSPLLRGTHAYLNWTGGRYRILSRTCRSCGKTQLKRQRLTQPLLQEFSTPITHVTRPWIRLTFAIIFSLPLLIAVPIINLLIGVFKALQTLANIVHGEL